MFFYMPRRGSATVADKADTIQISSGIQKSPTGIDGFDEITGGGLPRNRVILLSGGPGSGKTLMALEYLVNGAVEFGEPGVFMAFEEDEKEISDNSASLGFDLQKLRADNMLLVDFVYIEPSEFEETGEFDLEGLFVRLDFAIKSVGAKRVVLDTVEALFAGLPNEAIVRAELRRLFRWLKDKGVTAIITGERGDTTITRYGLEEYVSDCVIVLDHRVNEQVSTRRMRVVKYRGSKHGTNEFPFLIGDDGISVLPITSINLEHTALTDRVSSGVPHLDEMLDGKGLFKGSTILYSGGAGVGKTSLACLFVEAACERGDKAIYFAFEEGSSQITRNMSSIGIDLKKWVEEGNLKIIAQRPASFGLEMHLAMIHKEVEDFGPDVIVFDPITNFQGIGSSLEIVSMLARLIDYFKMQHITALFTDLVSGDEMKESTQLKVSSLMDTWVSIRPVDVDNERHKVLMLRKSRGMAHSVAAHELVMGSNGVTLPPVTFDIPEQH